MIMDNIPFSYILEFDDWNALNKHHAQQPRAKQVSWLFRTIPTIILLFNAFPYWQSRSWFTFVSFVVLAAVIFFGMPRYLEFNRRRQLNKMIAGGKNKWLGTYEATISPKGLSIKNDTSEETHKWETVEKIDMTDEYIFIYVTPVSAAIIPKQSFKGEVSFEELGKIAQIHFQTSGA